MDTKDVPSRDIPAPLKRELRQEAFFGCALCGSPIIDYHHIKFYSEVLKHEKENIIVLCPECHRRANCKEIPEQLLYEKKKSPYNKNVSSISKDFYIFDKINSKVKIGTNIFINTPKILVVDEKTILSFSFDDNGYSTMNAAFYDKHNKLLAEVVDNEWFAYDLDELWDIQYSPGHLKINKTEGKVALEFNVKSDTIVLTASIYYNGVELNLSPTKSIIGNSNNKNYLDCFHVDSCLTGINIGKNSGVEYKNSTFENCQIGINVKTK